MYFSEPFTHMQAWIDMILIASYKDMSTIYVRGNKVTVRRGQIGYSKELLASRWRWSRGKVLRFLNELENDNQIVQQKSKLISLITIVNYDSYQGDGTTDSTSNGTTDSTTDSTTDGTLYKNDKKEKNINNIIIPKKIHFAEFVLLKKEEYDKLCNEYSEEATKRMIEILNNYKGSSGKKYKSDYLAILNWVVGRYFEENGRRKETKANGTAGVSDNRTDGGSASKTDKRESLVGNSESQKDYSERF